MKTLNQLMVFACALSLFAACGSDNDEVSAGQSAPLRISTQITKTRAIITGTNFNRGDSIGVFALDGQGAQYVAGSMNLQSVYDGTIWSFPSGSVSLSDADASVYAYYPYSKTVSSLSVPVDITPNTEDEQTDYLYGKDTTAVNASRPEAQITFKHALALVDLEFTRSKGGTLGALRNVMLANAPSQTALALKGTMDVMSGKISPTADTDASLQMSFNANLDTLNAVKAQFMVIPVSLSNNGDIAQSIILYVTVGGKTYHIALPSVSLLSGTRYTFPITISVNKITVGQCTITPWTEGTDTPVTVLPGNYIKDAPLAVDLGLSVKWASYNVGATKPEGYGDLFSWGEIEPKSRYYDSDYKYFISTDEFTDIGSNISGTQYDVAHVKWGGKWRMPTMKEIDELFDQHSCTWTWTTVNGINGYQVTSLVKGYTDKSIFLPAAGCNYMGTGVVSDQGTNGDYWSGSKGGATSFREALLFNNIKGGGYLSNMSPYRGLSVRPVSD